jgi:hypothetical protein
MSDYKITDQDIDDMIIVLKRIDSNQANKEHALAYLQWMKAKVRDVSVQDPSSEDLYQLFTVSLGK